MLGQSSFVGRLGGWSRQQFNQRPNTARGRHVGADGDGSFCRSAAALLANWMAVRAKG